MFPHHRGRNILCSRFLEDVGPWRYLWHKTAHVDIMHFTTDDHIPKHSRNVPAPHIYITSSQFHTHWGHVYFSCLINIVTSNISHWLVFCHTLQSIDRQPPWTFSSWPSHLMLWIHYITGGFMTVSIVYYICNVVHYCRISTPQWNSQKIRIRIRIRLKLEAAKEIQ